MEKITVAAYQQELVQLNISDINVMKDLRHYISNNGWYDEFQLNPKLFQCRLDYFINLCKSLGDEISFDRDTKKALKDIASSEREKSAIEKIISGSFENSISEFITDISEAALTEVLKLIPFGGIAGDAIKALINILN